MEKRFLNRRLDLLEAEGVTFRAGVNVGVDLPAERAAHDVRRRRAHRRRRLGPRSQRAGPRAGGHPFRDGVPDAAEPPVRGRRGRAGRADHRRRQARRHHRRRRHGRRLLRHRHSPGREVGAPARASAAAAGRARAEQSLAGMAEHLPRRAGTRGGRRAGVLGLDAAVHGRCRRARASAARASKVARVQEGGRTEFKPIAGSEYAMDADLVLLAMGFVGPERGGTADRSRRPAYRARKRVDRRALDDERARRVRRGRHAARPVAHRLGDRRRAKRGAGRGQLPDGVVDACRRRSRALGRLLYGRADTDMGSIDALAAGDTRPSRSPTRGRSRR